MKTLTQHIEEKLLVNKNSISDYTDWTKIKYGFHISFCCLKEQSGYSVKIVNNLYIYPYELEDVTVNNSSEYSGTMKREYDSEDYFDDYSINKSEEFLYKIDVVTRKNRYGNILGGRILRILFDTKNTPVKKIIEYLKNNKTVTIKEMFEILSLKNCYKEIENELLNNDFGSESFSGGVYKLSSSTDLNSILNRLNIQINEDEK